jgi:hypothetical protein
MCVPRSYLLRVNVPSVPQCHMGMDSDNTLTCPMFLARQSLPGSLLPTFKDPQSLGDIPTREVMVVVHRETKEVFVLMTDWKVHKLR